MPPTGPPPAEGPATVSDPAAALAESEEAAAAHGPWWWVFRAALMLATGVSLYLLAPGLIALFTSWPQLKHLHPAWIAGALFFECFSYVSLWEVQRIALRTPSWFAVGTSQLAGGAAGSLIPGGGATASAFSYRLLVRAGVDPGAVAAGMTASFLATTSAVFALPVLAVPAVIGGVATPDGLVQTAYIGAVAFVVLVVVGGAALLWDAPLQLAGRAARWALVKLHRGDNTGDLPERLLVQRDEVRSAFGARWKFGVTAAVGKWGFDYLALVCCLAALGSHPDPSLVLLAYAAASLLGMIPLTPGGLGFVETGLAGMLALAGVGAQVAAVTTLTYRLVSFWLPLPCGGIALLLHRWRYGGGTAVSTASPP
jgi:uncharacterized protein (TIRG00374 family)